MQPKPTHQTTQNIMRKVPPDECGADEGGAEKGASYQLQKRRVPKLKGFEDAGDNKNP